MLRLMYMKKFIQKHKDVLTVLLIIFFWRVYYIITQSNAFRVVEREGYLGFLRIANFDGKFYLNIAQYGYQGLDQAFFPFFPLMIGVLISVGLEPISAAIIIVTLSLFLLLYFFSKLIQIDYPDSSYIWVILFFLSFPTSFFLGSIYTESLFLFLTISSFYFVRKEKIFFGAVIGGFAAGTRIVGIFLFPALIYEVYEQQKKQKKKNIKAYLPLMFIPIGLISYMGYLWYKYGDPLLFVHQQPLFGAGRSGGQIILLPQVIYRYVKIFASVPYHELLFAISLVEFLTFFVGIIILFLGYKHKIRKSYLLFSLCVLIFPTLSGTFSSLPRYALCAFAIFIYLGLLKNKILKTFLIILGLIIESIFAILFFQGYFIA